MKNFSVVFILFFILLSNNSCGKKEVCPTYQNSNFLSERKHKKQIKQYKNGTLTKKIKEKQKTESGDALKTSKKVQKKPVPKS